jgi:hypothetical protein
MPSKEETKCENLYLSFNIEWEEAGEKKYTCYCGRDGLDTF